jgi:hypothetical protein
MVKWELELIKQKLDSLGDVLEAMDVERITRHVREDREGMGYEVCSTNSFRLLELVLYRTKEDYDKDRPATIYVIASKEHMVTAKARAEAYRLKYKEAEVKVLVEGKNKKEIKVALNNCMKAKVVKNPGAW